MTDKKLCPYKLQVGSFNSCDGDRCQWWWKCQEPIALDQSTPASLASLWPKAGQVPSVEEIIQWLKQWHGEGYYSEAGFEREATEFRTWLLSRMGQPAKPDKFDCDNCDVTDLRPVQPSSVTAEKPIGSGRLTREQLVKMFMEVAHQKKAEAELLAGDVLHLALQPAKVSREQWEKLCDGATKVGGLVSLSQVRAWLKAEFGMEVAE